MPTDVNSKSTELRQWREKLETCQRLVREMESRQSSLDVEIQYHTSHLRRLRLRGRLDGTRLRTRDSVAKHGLKSVVHIVVPFASFVFGFIAPYTLFNSVWAGVIAACIACLLAGIGIAYLLHYPVTVALESKHDSIRTLIEEEESVLDSLTLEQGTLAENLTNQRQTYSSVHERYSAIAREQSWSFQAERLYRVNWRELRGIPFESYLARVFAHLGYQVEQTQASGDQGVDLIVRSSSKSFAIQVKGYSGSVGNSAVQQVYAGMRHYGCNRCAVVTNSSFTSSAIALASSTDCVLIDERRMRQFVMGDDPNFRRRGL